MLGTVLGEKNDTGLHPFQTVYGENGKQVVKVCTVAYWENCQGRHLRDYFRKGSKAGS